MFFIIKEKCYSFKDIVKCFFIFKQIKAHYFLIYSGGIKFGDLSPDEGEHLKKLLLILKKIF